MVTISVTEAHIRNGEPKDCRHCPVALALLDEGFCAVAVSSAFIAVDGKALVTPNEVHDFINHFDLYGEAQPFTFDLPL